MKDCLPEYAVTLGGPRPRRVPFIIARALAGGWGAAFMTELRGASNARHRYAVRGYASTAAKHGIAIFTAIRDALAGNPWIPPIPATA
jgi:hypothetical protein